MCSNTCNGGPMCAPGTQCCPSGCTQITGDPSNCGGCGITCPAGSNCVNSMYARPPATAASACTGTEDQLRRAAGCTDTNNDLKNCGACGNPCPPADTCVAGACKAPTQCNGGPACSTGQTCCPGSGCADLTTDSNHCGTCTTACGATDACVGGSCASGEGALNPTANPWYIPAGVHNYDTTITIPAGVTVYVGGMGAASGTLDLHASGAIVIDGTIDVSGGPGTQNMITSQSTPCPGRAGSGGFTGEPYESYARAPVLAPCAFVAGNPGQLGYAMSGSPGTCNVLSTTVCVQQSDPASLIWTGPVAQYGGGAGVFTGYRAYGSGGGGRAGGAPGALCPAYMNSNAFPPNEADCSGVSGGGGAVNGIAGAQGGEQRKRLRRQARFRISGADAVRRPDRPTSRPACVGGGGGGSIGTAAANDLAVLSTFQTGAGGGGGSADYLNRPVFGGTSGGGGGGGALRLTSPVGITVGSTGQILARGGTGGDAGIGSGMRRQLRPAARRGRRRRLGRPHLPLRPVGHRQRRRDHLRRRRRRRRPERVRHRRRRRNGRPRPHPPLRQPRELHARRLVQPAAGRRLHAHGVEARGGVHRHLPELR